MTRSDSTLIRIVALAGVVMGLAGWVVAQGPEDTLANGFRKPPDSANPRAWWHWMNGNVTAEGITADLEWMKRVGIAGMQMFDGDAGTPQFVEKRLVWMTPEWKDALRHAAAEADRLGMAARSGEIGCRDHRFTMRWRFIVSQFKLPCSGRMSERYHGAI
jgi:hypothetical protein